MFAQKELGIMHVPMYRGANEANEPCDTFLKLEDDNSLTTHYAKTATTSRPAPIRMCWMVRGAWSAELAVFLHTFITDVSDYRMSVFLIVMYWNMAAEYKQSTTYIRIK